MNGQTLYYKGRGKGEGWGGGYLLGKLCNNL